jgi:hypothetical protein
MTRIIEHNKNVKEKIERKKEIVERKGKGNIEKGENSTTDGT